MTDKISHHSNLTRVRLLVVGAAVLAPIHSLRIFESAVSDDAYILFRYARHLAHGQGLVWNAGEPPVEGFTSLLHVFALAGAAAVGLDMILVSQIIGILSAFACALATGWLAWEVSGGDGRCPPLAAVMISISPPLAAWSRGGMETVPFTALLCLALACFLRERRRNTGRMGCQLLFFTATLARPEALGLAIFTIGFDALAAGKRLRPILTVARWLPYLVLMAGLSLWRYVTFGDLLPNTYYAKYAGGLWPLKEGAVYVLRFLRDFGALNLLLAAVPAVLLLRSRSLPWIYAASTALLYSAFVAGTGGDYQYFGRYMVPVFPMLCSLASFGALAAWDATRGLPEWRRRLAGAIVAGAAAGQLVLPSIREVKDRPAFLFRPLRLVDPERLDSGDFTRMGKLLDRVIPQEQTVAAMAVGAIGYYCDRPVLDMLGLNDRIISRMPSDLSRHKAWLAGHMGGSAAEILRRRPSYIVLPMRPSEGDSAPRLRKLREEYPFVGDLLDSPMFQSDYTPEPIPMPDGRTMTIYRRLDAPPLRSPRT